VSALSAVLLGLTLAALVAAAIVQRRWARQLEELRAALERAASGDLSRNAEVPRMRETGALARAYNRLLDRVRLARGELEATNRDLDAIVEERTRELRRSERKYRSLVGQAAVGILLWDPEDRTIVEANPHAAELLGERPRDLLGHSIDRLFPEAERARVLRALDAVVDVGNVRIEETQLVRSDAQSFPAEVGASLIRLGAESLVLGILQDLTEKKELERRAALSNEQVRRTEKMASIGQLAAGVAHEINNPMGYVASNVNRLVEYAKRLSDLVQWTTTSATQGTRLGEIDELVGELEEIAQDASEGVSRVTEIVRALREFSHGGAGDEHLQRADLNNVVRNCLTLVHNEIKHRGQVVTELNPLPPVRCHPMQIAQVVMNLLRNAAQATGPEGTIRVATYAGSDTVQIAIEDQGSGIHPDHLPKIFEPFFTTKEVGTGTGLGLAVSRELVRGHGGEIWVDSRLGRGSRFVVELRRDGPNEGRGADA
jgi:PAS domain S-box-containing protein